MHKGINTTLDEGQTPVLAHALRGEGFDGGEDGTGRGTPIVPVHAFDARQSDVLQYGDKTGPLDTDGHSVAVMTPYVKATNPHSADEAPRFEPAQVAACLNGWDERHDPPKHLVAGGMAVRRLTPRECERLQGFPDDYTAISWRGRPADDCPDGPRYKALGNSWAVPVVRWIGRRISKALAKPADQKCNTGA